MLKWASIVNSQSIKTRFLASLFVNISRLGLSFISGMIIARELEPSGYGNFNFLLASFASIITLLDMGTSSAFYTFLSQKKRSIIFYYYYFTWLAIELLIAIFIIGILLPESWQTKIWLGHPRGTIILALLASFTMNNIWKTVTQAGESIRATVIVQLYNIIIAGLYLCIVVALILFHNLTIKILFEVIFLQNLIFSFILAVRLKNNLIKIEKTKDVKFQNIFREFKIYCTPIFILNIVGFGYQFADTWLLQKFGGAVQQGFYSVGQRFSSICLIATTSILSVFWKEIAEANALDNKERLYNLYNKISRSLCFISAIGACFLIPFSKEILVLTLGAKYEAAWLCTAIMFLYPIHQSLGQINGSYLYATTETKVYSRVNIIMMTVSMPITYFILASPSALVPGLGLGSIGLALKMVILQIIIVNLFSYIICISSKWKFDFLYQFKIIGVLLIASFLIKSFLNWIFHIIKFSFHPLVLIIFSIPLYLLLVGLSIYKFPYLSGIERRYLIRLKNVFNGTF
jgi:O-antigen/teichoic acid export membrane protein